MNNILIPLDMSSLPRSALLYSLHLMRGRECNIYLVPVCFNQKSFNWIPSENSELDCAQYVLKQEVISLQKKIENSFPGERYQFFLLDSLKGFQEKAEQFMLTILTNELKDFNMSLMYQQLLSKVKTSWLFVSAETKFTVPRRILLKIEPDVEIKQATLTPLKKLFGNQCFSLEVQKIYSGPFNPEKEKRDKLRLKELFDIYHPVIKLVHGKESAILESESDGHKCDLEILPQNKESIERKMSDTGFTSSLSNLETPLLIIPENEIDSNIKLRRSRKSSKQTLSHQ